MIDVANFSYPPADLVTVSTTGVVTLPFALKEGETLTLTGTVDGDKFTGTAVHAQKPPRPTPGLPGEKPKPSPPSVPARARWLRGRPPSGNPVAGL